MTRRLFPLAFLAGTLLLASCGGGGGSITGKGPEPDRPPIASAITDSGRIYTDIENIDSGEQIYLTYGLWNEPAAGGTRSLRADILSRNDEVNPNYADRRYDNNRSVDVSYYDDNGFVGIYAHDGKTGKITSDISLDLTINSAGAYVSDFSVGVNNPIVIEGQNLGRINGLVGAIEDVNSNGVFRDNADAGVFSNVLYSSGSIIGAFSDIDTTEGNPSLVAGEVKIRYGDYDNRTKNSLVGVFAAGVDE